MTAAIVPFRRTGSGVPRARASGRVPLAWHPAAIDQREVLRETRCIIRECWSLRAESRRIKRDYEARQARIELLMARYPDVERA